MLSDLLFENNPPKGRGAVAGVVEGNMVLLFSLGFSGVAGACGELPRPPSAEVNPEPNSEPPEDVAGLGRSSLAEPSGLKVLPSSNLPLEMPVTCLRAGGC